MKWEDIGDFDNPVWRKPASPYTQSPEREREVKSLLKGGEGGREEANRGRFKRLL